MRSGCGGCKRSLQGIGTERGAISRLKPRASRRSRAAAVPGDGPPLPRLRTDAGAVSPDGMNPLRGLSRTHPSGYDSTPPARDRVDPPEPSWSQVYVMREPEKLPELTTPLTQVDGVWVKLEYRNPSG